MRIRRPVPWPLLLVTVAACLGDPAGPGFLTIATDGAGVDTLWRGAPGEALPSQIRLRITDDEGRPLPAAAVTWEAVGRNAQVLAPSAETNAAGLATAGWLLGTDAAEEQQLRVSVRTTRHESEVVIRARAIPHIVSQIRVLMDSAAVVRLGDTVPVAVNAVDPYGNVFPAPDVTLSVTDSAIGAVAGQAFVGGPKRGRSSILVTSHGIAAPVAVQVTQYVAAIVPVSETLQFSALGAQRLVGYVVRDDRGRVVADTAAMISVADSSVAQVTGEYVRAVAPGFTTLSLVLAPAGASIPVGVQQRIGSLRLVRDTIRLDALMDTTTVDPIVHDSLGSPIPDPVLEFEVHDANVAQFASMRTLQALSPGATTVTVRDPVTGISTSAPVVVRQLIAKINLTPPVIAFDALGDTLSVGAVGEDRLGSVVFGAALDFSVSDAQVAAFELGARLRSVSPGQTLVVVSDPETGIVATADVQVRQRVTVVTLSADTVVFDALSDAVPLRFTALDRLGVLATSAAVSYTSSNPSIATVTSDGVVDSRSNGSALVIAQSSDGAADTVRVVVKQIATSVTARLLDTRPIVTASLGTAIALDCHAFDSNNFELMEPQFVVMSPRGRVRGGACADLVAASSGFDTLRIGADSSSTQVPLVVAIQPTSPSVSGEYLEIDSFPAGADPWSPTIWRNPNGQIELFTTVYYPDSAIAGVGRGDLHRYISEDGSSFRYDGVVLKRDSEVCSLNGSGIENVAIVSRQDSAGWRMFYAGGSFYCYGWQVFSAVSTDARAWTKEPGVRLSNGGTVPPAPSQVPPFPVGEGMVVDRLPSGDYRMIVGTFEHVNPPPQGIWQIAEWTSSDQINWAYSGVVLTTRDMPAGGQGSVYSPSIVQISPGLWRMFFTADNRPDPNSRSAVWTAVSVDRASWTIEGKLVGASDTDLYYASVLEDRLYFIRKNVGGISRLTVAVLNMP